jgi:hypothetical protein
MINGWVGEGISEQSDGYLTEKPMHGCGRSRRIGRVQEKTCDRLKVRRIKLSRANASSETQFYTVDICEDYHNTRIQRMGWYCQAAIDRPIVTCSGMLFPVCCRHELGSTEVLTEVSVQREGLYWGVTLGTPCTSNDGDWGDIQYSALTALANSANFSCALLPHGRASIISRLYYTQGRP